MSASSHTFDQIFGFGTAKKAKRASDLARQKGDLSSQVNALGNEAIQSTLERRLPIPNVDAAFKQMNLDRPTENDLLCGAVVPSNKNVVITGVNINYFATGSYKILWNKGGLGNNEFIDLFTDRAQDIQQTTWIACPPETQLKIVQGSMTSGTGYIAGVISVLDYDEGYKINGR